MILKWLAAKTLGIPRGVLVLAGLIVLILALVLWIGREEKADDQRNQEIGATVEREANTREVLERTEQGNEVRTEIEREVRRGNGGTLYAQCLRSARTPANCERYIMPSGQEAQR